MAKNKDLVIISDVTEQIANIPFPNVFGAAALIDRTARQKSPRVLSDYSSSLASFREKADAAEKVYNNCPLVKNAINMFIDLVFHRLVIRHSDQKVQDAFVKAFKYSNIEDAVDGILLDYFKIGNAFPYRFEGNTIEDPYDELFSSYNPFMWINLDPIKVSVEGEGVTDIEYVMEKGFGGGQDSDLTIDEEKLDPELVYHISAKKPVRQRKADPPLFGLARAVDLYSALHDASMANLEDAIPGFVHASVSGLGGRSPKAQTVSNVSSNIKEAKTRSIIVTSDAVSLSSINVNGPSIDPELYNAVIEQIEFGIGVSRELVTSSVEGGGSLQWFNITKLIKSLESARRKLQKWLDREVRYITVDLQSQGIIPDTLKEAPTILFDEIVLRDETRIRDILLRMYEKGMLSDRTCLEESNFDLQVELNRKAFEKEGEIQYEGKTMKVADLITPPAQPFQGNNGIDQQGGRPTNTNESQESIDREQE
jgi:hypothetical protein